MSEQAAKYTLNIPTRDPDARLAIMICRFNNGHESCDCSNKKRARVCLLTEQFATQVKDFCRDNFTATP